MPRREFGGRSVGPVLDDQLLLSGEVAAVEQHLVDVGLVRGRALQVVGPIGNFGPAVELLAGRQREGAHVVPVRRDERLGDAQVVDQGLPVVDVGHVERARPRCGRQAERHRTVPRCVVGVVGIGARHEIAVLVGAVVAPGRDDPRSGGVANALRRLQVHAGVQRIVAQRAQGCFQPRSAGGEQIEQAAIGRETDCGGLVGVKLLGCGAARDRHRRSQSLRVVRRPGVVDAGVRDGKRACDHGRPHAATSHFFERRFVPDHHDCGIRWQRNCRR